MKKFYISLSLILLLGLGAVTWHVYQKQEATNVSTIYTNDKFGYEIELANGWRVWSAVSAATAANNEVLLKYEDELSVSSIDEFEKKYWNEFLALYKSWNEATAEVVVVTNQSGNLDISPAEALAEVSKDMDMVSGSTITIMTSPQALDLSEKDTENYTRRVITVDGHKASLTLGKRGDPKTFLAQVPLKSTVLMADGKAAQTITLIFNGSDSKPLVEFLTQLRTY